jgi:hypothetical protein
VTSSKLPQSMERAASSKSNWTGRPVSCCETVALVLTRPPLNELADPDFHHVTASQLAVGSRL